MQLVPIIISVIGLIVSATSMIISLLIYRRTIVQEQQDLDIELLHSYAATTSGIRFLFVDIVAINKSKLPIALTGATLKLNAASSLKDELSYPVFHGMSEKVRISYLKQASSDGSEKIIQEVYSTPFPVNIPAMTTSSVTIAIKTPDYFTDINSAHKPSLEILTTGDSIKIPRNKLIESVTELSRRLKESFLR